MIYWTRWKDISLKSCIRRALKCRNIPKGTLVDFNKSTYHPGTKIDNSYSFKIKKENPFDPDYQISITEYFNNFKTCDFSREFTDILKENGFIVSVKNGNKSFISSMMETACNLTGKPFEAEEEEGETAIAYGFGKIIEFSSKKDSLFGYSNGCENILWDKFEEFNKWSRCEEIPKSTPIDEIISILKDDK